MAQNICAVIESTLREINGAMAQKLPRRPAAGNHESGKA
jgi:hypothetical protein